MTKKEFSYWHWLVEGSGAGPGIRRFWNPWLLLHAGAAVVLTLLVSVSLHDAANTVLLPLAGIFVGLSFAWAGNAQALLQSVELQDMADHRKGGFAEYVFAFQTAILTIMVSLVLWGVAGLSVFDNLWPKEDRIWPYRAVKFVLFFMSSLTLRECWQVVLASQWMLLAQRKIKRARAEQEQKKEDE
jgi:hypothetical protein